MSYTYTLMKKFINSKYYNYEQTMNMLDVYMGFNRISVEQYAELSILANEVYQISVDNAFVVDETVAEEPTQEETQEDQPNEQDTLEKPVDTNEEQSE